MAKVNENFYGSVATNLRHGGTFNFTFRCWMPTRHCFWSSCI